MSKLLFKQQPLNSTILRALKNGIEDMEQAKRKTYSMDIPSGFSYARQMSSCKSDIIKLTKELRDLEDWIIDSDKKIDNALKSMSNGAALLPQSQLQIRKEVVR